MAWSEAHLHAWLRRRIGVESATVGPRGDDAAVLRAFAGRPVLCSDQTIEGVHFEPGTPGAKIGHKAAARALSDLAATAARPAALLLNLHASEACSERLLRAIIQAVDRTGTRFGAPLVGGDLAQASGPLALSVTALGSFPSNGRPPGRDRIRRGDVLVVTGPLGGSRLGRHLRFEPRIEEGLALRAAGARAMMDVSDGLARDLARMADASRVRIELDTVPVHPDARRAARGDGKEPLEHALHDGEDHELLAAFPARTFERVAPRLLRRIPRLVPIARARSGRGLWLRDESSGWKRWEGRGGYVHGE